MTDLSGVADVMAHMRGSQELCMDLITQPDTIKAARDQIIQTWCQVFDALYSIIGALGQGCPGRHVWAADKHIPLQ